MTAVTLYLLPLTLPTTRTIFPAVVQQFLSRSDVALECNQYRNASCTTCSVTTEPRNCHRHRTGPCGADLVRAVLCRGGKAVDLSTDHKPLAETEKSRIESAGGFVNAVRSFCVRGFGGKMRTVSYTHVGSMRWVKACLRIQMVERVERTAVCELVRTFITGYRWPLDPSCPLRRRS